MPPCERAWPRRGGLMALRDPDDDRATARIDGSREWPVRWAILAGNHMQFLEPQRCLLAMRDAKVGSLGMDSNHRPDG